MARRLTNKEFREKARKVHEDKYDYSCTFYHTGTTKVVIICPEHGPFEQRGAQHLQGHGCPKCGKRAAVKNSTSTASNTLDFKVKALMLHGPKYCYTRTIYKNDSSEVVINCQEHGAFKQTPLAHLQGEGCPECAKRGARPHVRDLTREFVNEAKALHGDRYDYDGSLYVRGNQPLVIVCPEHGVFTQTPHDHLQGVGCPECEPLMTRKEIEAQQRRERAEKQKKRRAELHKKWTKERKEIDEHSDDPNWLETYVKRSRKNDEHHDIATGQMVVMLNPYELALLKRALLPSKGNETGYKSMRELLVSLAEKSLKVK